MLMLKRFVAFLLCAALCTPAAFAQDQPKPVRPDRLDADVTIIIQPQQIRFIASKPGEELQLQVFDQSGALIHDSGVSFAGEINWPLQTADGETLKNGLYAYTLTRKESSDKTARVRRGHFIVDRAASRDSADKLWVTSQNDNGVGVELTAAQDENATVVGATINHERTIEPRTESQKRDTKDREVTNATKSTTAEALAPNTIGRIAKFIGANNELGDSLITEVPGQLNVSASMQLTVAPNSANNGVVAFGTPNSEAGMTITRDSGRADVRFDGSTLKLAAGPVGGPPGPAIAINTLGNVGVGTIALTSSRMTVEGQDAMTLRGSGPFLTLQDISRPGANKHRIQSASGALGFFQEVTTQLGFSYQPRLVIRDDGNVQVGAGNSSIAASRVNAVIAGNSGDAGIAIAQNSGVNVLLQASGAGGYLGTTSNHPLVWRTNDQDRVVLAANGNLGVGTGAPATKLHIEGAGFTETTIRSATERAGLVLDSGVGGQRYVWTVESGLGTNRGLFGIYDRTANLARLTIDTTGLVSIKSLQLTGGADLAENFDVHSPTQLQPGMVVTPGMVVCIDAAHPGQLNLSRRAYDRRVAGVISGAGGIEAGMRMGQAGTLADGQHPVALTGRVYVWVDAARGAVKPGDLLTTSPTPGHAMKATNSTRAQGAILGKAMTALKAGKGLVLVLVTLQ